METQNDDSKDLVQLTRIPTWKHWKECWSSARYVEQQMGLLHVGLDVPLGVMHENREKERMDSLRFYLSVADRESASRYDPKVQEKAMQVLADRVFKTVGDDWTRKEQSWERILLNEEGFALVLKFFRFGEKGADAIINRIERHNPSHHEKITAHFLENMIEFCFRIRHWRHGYFHWEEVEQLEARVAANKLQLVKLLTYVGHLEKILNYYIEYADTAVLEWLEGLIFSQTADFCGEWRSPKNFAEACYAFPYSRSLRVAMVLKAYLSEKERFDKMRELLGAQKKTEQELTNLSRTDFILM